MRVLRLTHSADGGAHRVELAAEAPGRARRTAAARLAFAVPAADQELIRWYLEDYPEGPADVVTAGIARSAGRLLAELGEQLFRAMFEATADTRALWETVRARLADTRVEIVTGVAGATALPWELLREPGTGQPLALRAGEMVRAHPQAAQAPRLPAADTGRLRVLLVISRPRTVDVAFRSVAAHLVRLQPGGGVLRLEVLRPPSFARLSQVLREAADRGEPYQAVHFDGHGVWADASDDEWFRKLFPASPGGSALRALVAPPRPGAHGYLLFEDRRQPGVAQLAGGPELGNLLADSGVPLLFLNACRSADADAATSRQDAADGHDQVRAYGSLAQEVMDAGTAGVVAMRYEVYVGTAARFAADVYAGLLRGQPLGAATTTARSQLAAGPQAGSDLRLPAGDWAVPVVYEAAPLYLITDRLQPRGVTGPHAEVPADDLPGPPEIGFFGRDDILLALDRAFSAHSVVLLHGEAGIGKTAVAAEFGRWYRRTSGPGGPVLYTELGGRLGSSDLADQLAVAFAASLAATGLAWEQTPAGQRWDVVTQIARQRPLLWIWDSFDTVSGCPGSAAWPPDEQLKLIHLVRAMQDSPAKLLLVSRGDEQAGLGNLPARVPLPPMPAADSNLLIRAVAAAHQTHTSPT